MAMAGGYRVGSRSSGLTACGSSREDGGVAEPQPDTVRLLLEGHRALAAELLSSLEERGYPDARPAHAALFMNIDRRSGTRLTELARRARITKQGMMLIVDDLENRARRELGDRRYEALRSSLEQLVGMGGEVTEE